MNLSFLPASPRVLRDSHPQERRFSVTRHNERLLPRMADTLRGFAESPLPSFPCQEPLYIGRSGRATTAPESEWRGLRIPGVKAKGVFGANDAPGDDIRLVFPEPKRPYSENPQWHIRLDEEFRLIPVASKPKGQNTLSREGAEREFDCCQRVSQCGAALPGLLAGFFLDPTGVPVRDRWEKETGGVFSVHDPDSRNLTHFLRFLYIETSAHTADIVLPPSGHVKTSIRPLVDLVRNYTEFFRPLGELKARSILEGRVMRHSSHAGNYYHNPNTGKFYQEDFDTCQFAEGIPERLRAPQFVRDVATSMERMIRDLSLWSYSSDWFDYLKYAPSPFLSYLQGVFGQHASVSHIENTARRLQREYLQFLEVRPGLGDLAERYRAAHRRDDEAVQKDVDGRWRFIHTPFLADCICLTYALARESSLPEEFVPPPVKMQKLYDELIEGVHALRDRLCGRENVDGR